MSSLSDQQIEARITFAEAIAEITQYQGEIASREVLLRHKHQISAAPLLAELDLKLLQRSRLAKIVWCMELPVKYEYSLI